MIADISEWQMLVNASRSGGAQKIASIGKGAWRVVMPGLFGFEFQVMNRLVDSFACFRWWSALMVGCLSLFAVVAFADEGADQEERSRQTRFDYRAGFGGRSIPLGAAVFGDVGYSHGLWGDWRRPESVLYGYVRPALVLSSGGLVHSADLHLAVYPVSFLGFRAGRVHTYRASERSTSVNCWEIECGGELRADYGLVDVLLGARGFFFSAQLEWRDLKPSRVERDFFEDGAAIVGSRSSDRFFTHTETLGYQLGDAWFKNTFVGVSLKRTEAQVQRTFSQRHSLLLGHQWHEFKLVYAAGVYESSTQGLAPSLGFLVEWVGEQGLALR